MTITDDSKQTIDSLPFDELRTEVIKGNKSRFQGEKHDYAVARFAQLAEEKHDRQRAEDSALESEKISIAKKANDISKEANKFSKKAVWVSIIALLISVLNLIIVISTRP